MEAPLLTQKATESIIFPSQNPNSELNLLISSLQDIEKQDFTLKGHTSKILSIDIDPSSKLLASGDESGHVKIWSFQEKREIFTIKLIDSPINSIKFNPNQNSVFISQQNSILLVDLESKMTKQVLNSHSDTVTSIVIANDLNVLITGSADSTIKLWNISTSLLEQTINPNEGDIKSLYILNQNLISYHLNHKILLHSLSGEFHQREISEEASIGVSICNKTNEIALLSHNSISILNLSSLSLIESIDYSNCTGSGICFSSNGKKIVLISDKSYVSIYDRCSKSFFYLHGHSKQVTSAQFSLDSSYLLTVSDDLSIKVWNVQEKREAYSYFGHLGAVNCVELNNDESVMATCSSDKSIQLWDLFSNLLIKSLEGHQGVVYCCKFSPDSRKLASGSLDETIIVWNLLSFEAEASLTGHKFAVYSILFALNGLEVFSSSRDCTVRKWNLETKKEVFCKKAHAESIWSIDISSDGQFIATGSADKLVKIISSKTGNEVQVFEGHTNWVKSVGYTKDSKFLISASGDQAIKVWDLNKKSLAFNLNGHTGAVFSLSINFNDSLIATGSSDNYIKVWNLQEAREEFTIEAHLSTVNYLRFSKKSNILFSASADKLVKKWEISQKSSIFVLKSHEDKVRSIKASNNQNKLISCANDGKVKIWDLDTKKVIDTLQVSKTILWSLALSNDNSYFATASHSGELKIYGFSDKNEISAKMLHEGGINYVSISPDDLYIATGSNDKTVKLVDSKNLENVTTFFGHTHFVWVVEFTPNNKFLISGSNDKLIKIWNIETKLIERNLIGHTNAVYSLSISSDSRTLVSGSTDTTVKMWNIEEYKEFISFTGHSDAVRAVAISPSGQYAASASFDSYVIIWNLWEKRLEWKLKAHNDTVLCINFSPEGKVLYTGASDKLIKAWEINENLEFSEGRLDIAGSYEYYYEEPLNFLNVISSLRYKNFENLSLGAMNLALGPYKFTTIHYLCYLGNSSILQKYLGNPGVIIKSDNLGHSGLFYSIQKQNQNCTDMILNHMIELSTNYPSGLFIDSSFHSIRNDLTTIISNSSPFLHSLMDQFIISNNEKFYFGSSFKSLPMMLLENSQFPNPEKFFIEHGEESQPLVLKSYRYQLPFITGSASSTDFLNSLLICTNQEIFRTEFVQYYSKYIWNRELFWIYLYTFLVWANLISIILIVSTKHLGFVIMLIVINFLLLFWEILQMVHGFKEYIVSWWNLLDLFRLSFTSCWIILIFFNSYRWYIIWPTILLNIIRGLTGFRAFDKTRFYIKLILISVSNSKFFLIIFIYTTICFGLLSSSSIKEGDYDYKYLWVYPFELTIGDTTGIGSNEFELKYLTFCLMLIVNIVLMLNMLISILGDSFDEFQLKADIYDFTEIIEVLVEIEQIKSVFVREDTYCYLHICDNPHRNEESTWGGKLMFIHKEIVKTKKSVNDSIKRIEGNLKDNFRLINENFYSLNRTSGFDYERIENIENRLAGIEGTLSKILGFMNKGMQVEGEIA